MCHGTYPLKKKMLQQSNESRLNKELIKTAASDVIGEWKKMSSIQRWSLNWLIFNAVNAPPTTLFGKSRFEKYWSQIKWWIQVQLQQNIQRNLSHRTVFLNFFWFTAPFFVKTFGGTLTLVNYYLEAPLKLSIVKFHEEYQQITRKSNIKRHPFDLFTAP